MDHIMQKRPQIIQKRPQKSLRGSFVKFGDFFIFLRKLSYGGDFCFFRPILILFYIYKYKDFDRNKDIQLKE
jgi:hypothetical protein